MARQTCPATTPWGAAQQRETLAPGIVSVSTAGHGGIWLSPDRARELVKRFPGFVPFTGHGNWLEEDCDWAIAAIAWPEAFDAENLAIARKIVASMNARKGYFGPEATAALAGGVA